MVLFKHCCWRGHKFRPQNTLSVLKHLTCCMKIVTRVRKKELGDWNKMEVKTESQNAATTPWSSWWCWWLRERSSGYQSKESTWLSWETTIPIDPRTLLKNALPSFSILQFSLLTLRCTWTTDPKACAMPTNSNRHMLVQRLLTCTCWMGVCET